ncbi:peripherin-2 [Onthophagus taurus]|uniref:peripherin-2 n=1 Tax=Onthophagus taurus TaxID=166361 RepID=UPI0039BE561D
MKTKCVTLSVTGYAKLNIYTLLRTTFPGYRCFLQYVTKQQRLRMGVVFSVLNALQVLLGILTTTWSLYVILGVAPKLYTEKPEIDFVFTCTGMYGTHVIIHFLVGMKICEKTIFKAHKKSTKQHLLIWCLIGCNTILNIIILSIVGVKISKHIAKSMRHSLEKGMQSYLTSPMWKRTIDNWQFHMQCCGVNDYKDWYELTWLDKYHIDITQTEVQSLRLSQDRFHFPVIPWSCCRRSFPMQCLHDPLQQIQSVHLWHEQPKLVLESINTEGCLDKLRAPIRWSLIGFTVVCTFLVLFQLAIIIVSRLLYTSCKNSIILRDPEGESPGYILTRGCIGKAHKTISELVIDLKSKEDRKKTKAESTPKKKLKTKFIAAKNLRKVTLTKLSPKALRNKIQQVSARQKKEEVISTETYDTTEEGVISSEDEQALMLK